MNTEFDKLEISSEEVKAFKMEIAQTPGGIQEATKLLRQYPARFRARIYPTTRPLYYVWVFLGFLGLACLTVFPIALFLLTRWYWALAPIILNFVLVQPIHNYINLELFARIF